MRMGVLCHARPLLFPPLTVLRKETKTKQKPCYIPHPPFISPPLTVLRKVRAAITTLLSRFLA